MNSLHGNWLGVVEWLWFDNGSIAFCEPHVDASSFAYEMAVTWIVEVIADAW